MNSEMRKTIVNAMAQRLGLEGEATELLGDDPLPALLALSLMGQAGGNGREDGARIRRVAAIVGACPTCLGDDLLCPDCAGNGRPGYRAPDRAAFLEWTARPLKRLGLAVCARNTDDEHLTAATWEALNDSFRRV